MLPALQVMRQEGLLNTISELLYIWADFKLGLSIRCRKKFQAISFSLHNASVPNAMGIERIGVYPGEKDTGY